MTAPELDRDARSRAARAVLAAAEAAETEPGATEYERLARSILLRRIADLVESRGYGGRASSAVPLDLALLRALCATRNAHPTSALARAVQTACGGRTWQRSLILVHDRLSKLMGEGVVEKVPVLHGQTEDRRAVAWRLLRGAA